MLIEKTKNQDQTSLVERRRNGSFVASEVALEASSPVNDDKENKKKGDSKKHIELDNNDEESHPTTTTTTTTTTTESLNGNLKNNQPHEKKKNKNKKREDEEDGDEDEDANYKPELVWTNIGLFVILHSCLPVGTYMLFTQWPWKTVLYSIFGMYASGLGVTGGSHRLWSHRAYKAKWPVQVLLVCLQTMAGQNSIYTWSRDHRVHHKFAETNADPHNIKRGFFFAHMGWLCCKKHPDVKEKGKLIDMSDLEANPYVMFQHRHFWWMAIVFTVLVPTMIPVFLWNERFWTSFVFSFMVRYLITLHGTWLVNSAAHYYGDRPYDKKIEARESPYVIFNGLGEGFHNYHHTFPYDYATSEFGKYMNITTTFIDFCAAIGLVQDRRKVNQELILRRRARTGDKALQTFASSSNERNELEPTAEEEEEGEGELLQSYTNNNNNNNTSEHADKKEQQPETTMDSSSNSNSKQTVKSVGKSLADCGRLLVDNWRLSSGAAAAVVQDSAQQSSLISMIHA